MEQFSKDEKSSKTELSKNLILVFLVLLVLISGTKLYLDHLDSTKQTAEISALTVENEVLSTRLDSVEKQLKIRIQELEKLGANVTELRFLQDQLIQEKKSNTQRSAREIDALNQRIKDLSNLLVQKDKEISQLQERFQSLSSENEVLKSNQSELEKEVTQINLEKQDLATKVAEASKLKVAGIRVSGMNAKGKALDGKGKTFKKKQIKGIQILIQLADNSVAEKGSRTAYLQLVGPNKLPIFDLAKGSGKANWAGKEEFYTAKQEFWFDTKEQTLEFFYEKGSPYVTGNYEVKLYVDKQYLGSSSFVVE
jgi:predicted  nucleic acid-binding Zn-ribbon protein